MSNATQRGRERTRVERREALSKPEWKGSTKHSQGRGWKKYRLEGKRKWFRSA